MADKDNLFGERLKMLRSLQGNKSQKDFAVELGIPSPHYLPMKAEKLSLL